MDYPDSKTLGYKTGPDGLTYSLHFYGENEGAAVITGPIPMNTGRLEPTPEVHREPAKDAGDAESKLAAWMRTAGWSE